MDAPPLRPVAPILTQYKTLLKITTRDVSLKTHYKDEIASVLRELERWISEAKVSADPMVGLITQVDTNLADAEFQEYWALEQLCKALIEPGAIVPLARKYVCFPSNELVQLA